jgi:hypothetical protein
MPICIIIIPVFFVIIVSIKLDEANATSQNVGSIPDEVIGFYK